MSSSNATQDLSGKMLVFPQETSTAHVKLFPVQENFAALSVCHRSFTDLQRDYGLFSLSVPSFDNGFLTLFHYKEQTLETSVQRVRVDFAGTDYGSNKWHSMCTTWSSSTGLVQLWLDGQPLAMKYVTERALTGKPIVTLGQEQDSYGGGFVAKDSFVGMMTDVHVWDYALSACEIQKFMKDQNFTPGNVINWAALDCEIQDLSGNMFVFPQESNTAHVRLTAALERLPAATVCHRSFTALKRSHTLFSMATPTITDCFLTIMRHNKIPLTAYIQDHGVYVKEIDYAPNKWHSICTTWSSTSGLAQAWLDGQPLTMTYTTELAIPGRPIITLGQDQDSYGGGFDIKQSFVGMMTDVHMWDYVLHPCEIQKFMEDRRFRVKCCGNRGVTLWRT